ncbi:MAG: AMP-binding protein, partial [Bacteroidota bacterium]
MDFSRLPSARPMQIHSAPATSKGQLVLGRTLPSLLDDAVQKHPNPKAFNNPAGDPGTGWRSVSNAELQTWANEIAVGMRALGLERGDKVAFFMNSDLYFQAFDFGTLIAGLVNVPLYTTYARENLVFCTTHSESKALVVSNPEMLAGAAAWIGDCPEVKTVVLAEGERGDVVLPDGVTFHTFEELRAVGRESEGDPNAMREEIDAKDLATIIYTSGTTGQPKGVMLSHENISSNVYSAINGIALLGHQEEVVLTFLPMTHIYARTLNHACSAWGMQLYYSHPDR